MTTVQWRSIPGLDSRYEVSDLGDVRSWIKIGSRPGTVAESPHLLHSRLDSRGEYLIVDLVIVGRKRNVRVHRLVGAAFLGNLPEGQQTRHLNGNSTDNRLTNLRYGTARENTQDAIAHGTHSSVATRARTHCLKGHAFDGNFYVVGGVRVCRTCSIARSLDWQHRDRDARERAGQVTNRVIRRWAAANGYALATTGRIHNEVKAAFWTERNAQVTA